jgi:prephenate dehydratase
VLSVEEYAEFQQMLAQPPRAIPALVRLFKLQRLKGEADAYRALAKAGDERVAALQASTSADRVKLASLEAELAELQAEQEAGKEYPGEEVDSSAF